MHPHSELHAVVQLTGYNDQDLNIYFELRISASSDIKYIN